MRYSCKIGRPREHDQRTAAALFAAAERTIREDGIDALSVRGVAKQIDASTRAVYSLFGSKEGLVAALAAHGFDLLGAAVTALPYTEDPIADLVAAGLAFRTFALEHPTLFAISIQRPRPNSTPWLQVRAAANDALAELVHKIARLADAGGLGGRSLQDAACQFHALCEGLAALELRGVEFGERSYPQRLWEEALTALVTGFAAPVAPARQTPAPAAASTSGSIDYTAVDPQHRREHTGLTTPRDTRQ